jgi:type III secretory pathway component EscR
MPLWQVTLIIFAVSGVVATPLIVVLAQREKETEANLNKPSTVIRNVDEALREYLELLQKNARKNMG